MSKRDYSSFSSAAKSRFRNAAAHLGYEQITGITYAKRCGDWFATFNLQAASYGNDFFYVNYGIATPDLCPVIEAAPIRDCGLLLWHRLPDIDGSGAFDRGSKKEIEGSASRFLKQYEEIAVPWFETMNSWSAIASEFYRTKPIEIERLGHHSGEYGDDLSAATYGYLLLKSGQSVEALRWLQEAERILSLPVYLTRDGRTVHEREKYSRLQKPEDYEVESLDSVRRTISLITAET